MENSNQTDAIKSVCEFRLIIGSCVRCCGAGGGDLTMWTLALAVAAALFTFGWTINAVLYAPWRVKPLYRLIHARSAWYRSWCFRQVTIANRKLARAMGERLVPAMQKATQAMRELMEAQPNG